MHQYRIILLVFIFNSQIIYGQSEVPKWAVGADFEIINPIHELRSNGFSTNLGFNLDVFYLKFNREKLSFQPGFRFRAGGSGMNSRNEFIGVPINQDGIRGFANVAIDGKLAGRLIYTDFNIFRPYIEADIGVRFAGANEKIETFGFTEEESLDYSEFINSGFSGTYGFGAGFLFTMLYNIDLNLRANLDFTNHIKHVDLNTPFPFDETRTTNAINQRFSIGIIFYLGMENDESEENID